MDHRPKQKSEDDKTYRRGHKGKYLGSYVGNKFFR